MRQNSSDICLQYSWQLFSQLRFVFVGMDHLEIRNNTGVRVKGIAVVASRDALEAEISVF